jgi:RNA polymerase sigma-70 factor, ECF subfamily
MAMLSVAQLVDRSRGGDQEAFGGLVDLYRDMVYGLAFHLTGSFEEARDLTQETFVQAYLKLGQLREATKFGGWLRQIAVNLHRAQVRQPRPATVPLGDEVEAVSEAQPSEIQAVVREALRRLREPERLALTLHYIDGYSQAEIGAFLGVEAGTIKGRLARARRHLREEVMQMVEEMFDRNALPPEFSQDVIRAVNGLVTNLRSALPPDLRAVSGRLHRRRNEAWRALRARVPEALLPRPLKAQGEARAIRVCCLPEDLREEARAATCLTWFDLTVQTIDQMLPWVSDFEVLWIRFCEGEGRYVRLADMPGDSGNILTRIPIGHEARSPRVRGGRDVLEMTPGCAQPPELRGTFRRLRQAVPGRSGTLGDALHAAMATHMRQARDLLPPAAQEAMGAGRSVSIRDLPETVRELVRTAVHLHWGSYVLALVENPPDWLVHFDEGAIEFGVYQSGADLPGEARGQEYVEVRCAPTRAAGDYLQTGIGEAFDVWPSP